MRWGDAELVDNISVQCNTGTCCVSLMTAAPPACLPVSVSRTRVQDLFINIRSGRASVWSTLIGPAMSRLGSHWSRASLVMLAPAVLCHKEQAPSRGLWMPELVLYGIRLLANTSEQSSTSRRTSNRSARSFHYGNLGSHFPKTCLQVFGKFGLIIVSCT